jgi:hypothetical protein
MPVAICISKGANIDIQVGGVIFFTATGGIVMSRDTELSLAPDSLFGQLSRGTAFVDGAILSTGGSVFFTDDATFGATSIISLQSGAKLGFFGALGNSDGQLTATILTPSFLIERSFLTFPSTVDTQIIVRSLTSTPSKAHLNITGPTSLVDANTVHVDGEEALLSVYDFAVLSYSLLKATNGARIEMNDGRVLARSSVQLIIVFILGYNF